MRCLTFKQFLQATAITVIFLSSSALCQSQASSCATASCYPATGDLLIGREANLKASSTCGLTRPQPYCILAYLLESNKSAAEPKPRKLQECFACESSRPYFPVTGKNSHRIENVISKIPSDEYRWWQSENGVNNVSITLNLGYEFHFTHLIMTFKTFRPAAMFIERSYDFGTSWHPYRYYSANCQQDFPTVSREPMKNIGDVICTSEYTDMSPSTRGEVIFRAVPSHLTEINDPYSDEVQNLVKLTNLRINFVRLHTLGDLLIFGSRPNVIRNYYYALYELNVRGSCSCYGHAKQCVPENEDERVIENMVYGMCNCTHNTMGMNCHKCKPFYNNKPWKPATIKDTNECEICQCNGHAKRCHFDAAVYRASNLTSGGVCDDCEHNTQGKNCQECRSFFYQDPKIKDLSDPNICQPCDCDPYGSEHRGECEQRTDPVLKTKAGRCICKKNAGGARCDRCLPGYWNFTETNPNACQKCKCHMPGTSGNKGCSVKTGLCKCKRFVVGKNCDKCITGYYGLSASNILGCKPCDCDRGGSVSAICSSTDGQCQCKEGMEGRRCDKLKEGYFVPQIHVNVFEVEDKMTGGTGKRVIFPSNATSPTHTGRGVVELKPGQSVTIAISPSPGPGLFDVAIRLSPKEVGSEGWPDIRVTITRPKIPDPNSFCGQKGAKKVETYYISIKNESTGAVFLPKSLCLGPNEVVKMEIYANPSTAPSPNSKLNIDSVVLLPGPMESVLKQPIGGTGSRRDDWLYCRDLIMSLLPTQLPEKCKKLKVSVSVFVSGKPTKCHCNPTGSLSFDCSKVGGQCFCKPGVEGRDCRKCKDYHFGFSIKGCQRCDCDLRGAKYAQCNPTNGQCYCNPSVRGRKCNECFEMFWSFPNCLPCNCNGHAVSCDSLTGKCQNCSSFTEGDSCERCRKGYYGDPIKDKHNPCKPCYCPGALGDNSTSTYRATGCTFDKAKNKVVCNCLKGYTGDDCSRCSPNYYGNPLVPASKCRQCDCNNNIDRSDPGSCDSETGDCLKCLYHTTGSNCQECSSGYFGEATKRQCKKCICNKFGSKKGEFCDKKTGDCSCLPNVIGRTCNKCAPKHWNITSGNGCAKCDCDVSGTKAGSMTCNELSGQCECKSDRGGRRCNECSDAYWGNPLSKEGCKECNCVKAGSKSQQCDRRSGKCRCNPGVTGEKCDRCDRGTRGKFPKCEPCGECWIRWYQIIDELFNKTVEFSKNAGKISGSVSLPKDYADKLNEIEKQLQTIEDLLKSNNITSKDVKAIQNQLQSIKSVLKSNSIQKEGLEETQKKLEENEKESDGVSNVLKTLDTALKNLKEKVDELKKEAIDIKDSNINTAYQTIMENKKKSTDAQTDLNNIEKGTQSLKSKLDDTKDKLVKEKESLKPKLKNMRDRAKELEDQMRKLKQETIPTLNKKVCGWTYPIPTLTGQLCHASCGGGGCKKCGGAAVCKGSIDNMKNAENHLNDTKKLLNDNIETIKDLEKKIQSLSKLAKEAETKAQEARAEANKVGNASQVQDSAVKSLLSKMQKFLDSNRTRQEDLQKLLKEITDTKPEMTEGVIKNLKEDIKNRVEKLQNVQKILDDTKKDREQAEQLQKDAKKARNKAEELQKKADDIAKDQEKAKKAQNDANKEVEKLKISIKDMTSMLDLIKNQNDVIEKLNNDTEKALDKAQQRMDKLNNALKNTKTTMKQIEKENEQNTKKIGDIEKIIKKKLEPEIKIAEEKMKEKERLDNVLSNRGKKLRDRIKKVNDTLTSQLKRLKDAEANKEGAKKILDRTEGQLTTLIDNITKIFKKTRELVNYHQLC